VPTQRPIALTVWRWTRKVNNFTRQTKRPAHQQATKWRKWLEKKIRKTQMPHADKKQPASPPNYAIINTGFLRASISRDKCRKQKKSVSANAHSTFGQKLQQCTGERFVIRHSPINGQHRS